jgi:hypothetical protein
MKVKLFIGLFVIGLLAFNFSQKRSGEDEKGMTWQNVAVIQANAGKMYCDQVNEVECTITTSSGVVGKSIGRLIVNH